MKTKWLDHIQIYRFEFLTATLIMLLFDRACFTDGAFFSQIVWPINMVALGFSSFGIFREKSLLVRILKNILFLKHITV
jgi:hypothetical protein